MVELLLLKFTHSPKCICFEVYVYTSKGSHSDIQILMPFSHGSYSYRKEFALTEQILFYKSGSH